MGSDRVTTAAMTDEQLAEIRRKLKTKMLTRADVKALVGEVDRLRAELAQVNDTLESAADLYHRELAILRGSISDLGRTEPFCACGRIVSQCDGSRRGCRV